MRLNRVLVLVVAVSFLTTALLFGGDAKPADGSGKDHDFGSKILYLVTKPKDAKGECGYGLYEKVKMVRLGDRSFLVGQIPDYGEGPGYKAASGKTVWTPISEIVQIVEFKTLEDAKNYFETVRKPDDNEED